MHNKEKEAYEIKFVPNRDFYNVKKVDSLELL